MEGYLRTGNGSYAHEILQIGRGPVYSVRPVQFTENNNYSEDARFDDDSPAGKAESLDLFRESAPVSLGYPICER